jgi:hypothetical protein
MNEAVIALCKCKEGFASDVSLTSEQKTALASGRSGGKLFGIRFEKMETNNWKYTWAFPIKESTARREGYEGTTITGNVEPAPGFPGCPYCRSNYFVVCQCGKLSCNTSNVGRFTCGWCGLTGELTAGIGEGIKTGKDR